MKIVKGILKLFGAILGILVLIILGKEPYFEVKNYLINFPEHWAVFVDQSAITWSWINEHTVLSMNWLTEHVISSSNWLGDQINAGWEVVRDQWLPAIKVK